MRSLRQGRQVERGEGHTHAQDSRGTLGSARPHLRALSRWLDLSLERIACFWRLRVASDREGSDIPTASDSSSSEIECSNEARGQVSFPDEVDESQRWGFAALGVWDRRDTMLDSPPFTPDALGEFAGTGFLRRNRWRK